MKKTLSVVTSLALLAISSQAFALTAFTDVDTAVKNKIDSNIAYIWTQTLDGLSRADARGIADAVLSLDLLVKPKNDKGWKNVTLDVFADYKKLGTYSYDFLNTKKQPWAITDISLSKDLKSLYDRKVDLMLVASNGAINKVATSTITGRYNATVAPEPASMMLVASGLAGLPFARRLRRGMKSSAS